MPVLTAVSEVDVEPRGALAAPVTTPAWNAVAAELAAGDASRDPGIAQFRFASEYVPLAEQFADYAKTSLKPDCPIVEGVADLTARIHADFRFDPKATNLSTPVREVFERRAGVCQDFAHLQLACLRSLGLAAQYVSGYLRTDPPPGKPRLVGADASHAWISVYCGAAGWIDFDPTNNVMPGVDHITVAYGRDYADICPIQGVFIGGGRHAMHVAVDVMPVE